MDIRELPAWRALQRDAGKIRPMHLRQLFADDRQRIDAMHLKCGDLLIDFSKQRLLPRTLTKLRKLATARDVSHQIARLFAGETVNPSEGRAALHMALRAQPGDRYLRDGRDLVTEVLAERRKLAEVCRQIENGIWRGATDETITDVVNLGIGGSDLGPRMAVQALTAFGKAGLRLHFVSNVDGADLATTLRGLDPSRTLLVIVSKTFTTQETMGNARSAIDWLSSQLPQVDRATIVRRHCLGVTAKPEVAAKFGIPAENVLAFWDWVGGRYSLWSSVGIGIALAIGMDAFEEMLAGARAVDAHFRSTPFEQNVPVTLALVDVWNNNFLGAETHAIVPYSNSLKLLTSYLQQLEMESNGKSVSRDGDKLAINTAAVIWGTSGTDAQHSYFQLLHQGGRLIPIDFIAFAQADFPLNDHQRMLLANCLAQSEALMQGRTFDEALQRLKSSGLSEAEALRLAPHKTFPGNQPSTTIMATGLTPRTLGSLIALFEHKVFVAASIWGVNPFDQFGVELGKEMANDLLPALSPDTPREVAEMSASTRLLLDYCRHHRATS